MKLTGGHDGPKVRMLGGNGDDALEASGAGNAKLSDSEGQNRAIEAKNMGSSGGLAHSVEEDIVYFNGGFSD